MTTVKYDKKMLNILIKQKGIKNKTQLQKLINPQKKDLYDPFLYQDMQKAVDRIKAAIDKQEQITIYGDYDVDGITSTSIVYEALLSLGAKVNYYIPNRFKDGYGANPNTYQKLINQGTQLFITVDNGIRALEAIDYGNEHHVSTIVTDHHEMGEKLPNAYAIIHAKANHDPYPFKELSGAGVAFKLANALLGTIPKNLIELAALGIVADLVSMTDENHTIVKFGLIMLSQTKRPGLIDLLDDLNIDRNTITEQTISFRLAPVLNSLGRMGDANVGVELLTTHDQYRASKLAKFAKDENEKRKNLVNELTKEAYTIVKKQSEMISTDASNQSPITIVAIKSSNLSRGVAGIVASKLVELTQKPSLCLILDENGIAKGSGRSVIGFNLYQALSQYLNLMENFGGHEMACGITISEGNLNKLKKALLNDSFKVDSTENNKQNENKISLLPTQITTETYTSLRLLAPYGTDFSEPEFSFTGVPTDIKVIGQDQTHVKFKLGSLVCLGFGKANEIDKLNQKVDITGKLNLNVFNGRKSTQCFVDTISDKL